MKNFVFCLVLCVSAFANTQISGLEKECENGNLASCMEAGEAHKQGCIGVQNFEAGAKAIKYFEKVCKTDEFYGGCHKLFFLHTFLRDCVEEDKILSLKYAKMSCEKENNKNACHFYNSISATIENFRNDCKNGEQSACEWLKSQGY